MNSTITQKAKSPRSENQKMTPAPSQSPLTATPRPAETMTPLRFVMAMLLCLLILAALGTAGYSRYVAQQAKSLASPEKARKSGRPMPVRTEVIREAEFNQVIGATAITEPSQKAIVRFSGAGDPSGQRLVVANVLAKEGQRVQKGDVLFEIGRETLELVAKQLKAVEAAAEAEFQGIERLYQRKAASKYELQAAEIKLESARVETEIARRNLAASTVVSPISGQLDLVEAVAGEAIDTNLDLTTVYQLDPIHVRVEVPQERVVDLEQGSTAEVVIDSFPHDVFRGTVISISPQVNPDTRVLSAVVEVTNSDQRIKAGMSGFARFQQKKTALIVPDAAVVELNGKASVFVVEDGHAKLREVRTGPLVETGKRVVDSGLSAADEVVIYGQAELVDGDPVDTNWKNWTRRKSASNEPVVESKVANADDPAPAERQ